MLMELDDEEGRIEYNLTKIPKKRRNQYTKLPNNAKVTLRNNLKKLKCKRH